MRTPISSLTSEDWQLQLTFEFECNSGKGKANNLQTRCIVKARLRRVHFSGDFLRGFDFLRSACSLGIPQENPLNSIKSPIFTNTPCKFTCLYNAPSIHTVEKRHININIIFR